jgi:hypothetical protein
MANHQGYMLFSLLKAAGSKGVTRSEAAKALGVRESSVPVYFYGLRTLYGAEIEVQKNGRKVIGYTLLNPNECTIGENGRRGTKAAKPSKSKPMKSVTVKTVKANASKKAAAVSAVTPILDSDLEISEIDDAELNDLKASLGIG